MDASLSPEQRSALSSAPGMPLTVVDEGSHERFVIVAEPSFLHLQGLAAEKASESTDRLRSLIQEGIDSREIPAAEAFARLRALAETLSASAP